MIIESILAALLPAAVDLAKGGLQAWQRKKNPVTVEEQIKLDNASVERLKALAELDNPHGEPSQWVVDLRASFRYIAAGLVILIGAGVAVLGIYLKRPEVTLSGLEVATYPFSFVFGERMYLGFKGNFSK